MACAGPDLGASAEIRADLASFYALSRKVNAMRPCLRAVTNCAASACETGGGACAGGGRRTPKHRALCPLYCSTRVKGGWRPLGAERMRPGAPVKPLRHRL